MRNLIQRGDTWHFRGFVPKDLIPVVGKREVHKSLKTSSHAEAVHKRDTARIRHREWIEEERRRHERKFLVLDELSDEQILDIAREVYAQQWEIALERREEFAEEVRTTDTFATGGYEAMYEELRRGVVIGGDLLGLAEDFTDEILDQRLIDISRSPKSRKRLQQRVAEVVAQVQIDLLAMINGKSSWNYDSSLIDPDRKLPREPSFEVDGRPGATRNVKHTLDPLTDEFLSEVRLRRRDKGFVAIKASMKLIKEFFGPDMDVRRIRRRQCNQFRDFMMGMPSNYTKRYPRKAIRDIPGLRKPEHDVMSYANINKIIRHLIQFLGWCEEMEVIDRAPSSKNLVLPDPVSEKEKRQPFTPDQLRQIFTSPLMQAEASRRSMFFWCYVIGLYHGLRLNEIAGLDAGCVVNVDGTPCLDVRVQGEILDQSKPGWTKTLPRTLPLHWVLIELGLPAFASSRPKGAKLFDEAKIGVDGYWSSDVSDRTRAFLDSLGIPPGGPTFHSLRHCFRDAMSEADLSQEVSAFFGGWKLPGVMNEVYGSSKLRKSYKSQIDKVSYGGIDQIVSSLTKQPVES